MSQRTKIVLILMFTLGAAIYLSADSEDASQDRPILDVKRVKVAQVSQVAEERGLRFSGVTRAARRARLAFSVGGRLVSRPVDVGDPVRKGQLIARLDVEELENAVATATATLAELEARRAQTQRDLERAQQLVNAKAATDEELERTRAAKDSLEAAERAATARLAETRRLLDEGTLRAPFAGTITEIFYEPGEVATPGMSVALLSGSGEVELEVEVPESVVPRIAVGDLVTVELPVLGDRTLEGRVTSVGRTTTGPGRLFPVVVTLPEDADLAAGVTAELVLRLRNEEALALPVEAVINPGGQRPSVFQVVDEGGRSRVQKVAVEIGALLGDRVTVQGELVPGDRVVVGGQRGLLSGEEVEVDR